MLRQTHFLDYFFNLLSRVRRHKLSRDQAMSPVFKNVATELHRPDKELRLALLGDQLLLGQPVQHHADVLGVVLKQLLLGVTIRANEDVIHIRYGERHVPQHPLHLPLEN